MSFCDPPCFHGEVNVQIDLTLKHRKHRKSHLNIQQYCGYVNASSLVFLWKNPLFNLEPCGKEEK